MLIIFLFNTAGYYVTFLVEQIVIKNEIRSQINSGYMDDASTTIITIGKAEKSKIVFYDENEEMRYNDRMYDIVKTIETKNTITYYCINDFKETSLIAGLNDHINTHVASNIPVKNNGSKKITENVIKVYFSSVNSFTFSLIPTNVRFSGKNIIYVSAQKQNDTPPPPEFC